MTEQDELAACPRCGRRAFIAGDSYSVWCVQDNCLQLPPRSSRAEAIAAWNQRPDTKPTGDVREALVGRIEYILDPTASAAERMNRRAHLTNHDLRSILTALQSPRSCCAEERDTPVCQVPPAGWYCTRDAGHDGPCAARPIDPLVKVIRHWLMSEDHPVSKWEIEFATAIRSADHD